MTISTPSGRGSAPPDRPVPEPRATNGTPAAWHSPTTCRTSSALPGSTAAPGRERSFANPSDSYVASSASSRTMPSGPTMRSRSARNCGSITASNTDRSRG